MGFVFFRSRNLAYPCILKDRFCQVHMGFDSGPSSWAGSVSPALCLPGSGVRWTIHHVMDICRLNKYPAVYMVSRPWSWPDRFPAESTPGVCISSFIPFNYNLTYLPGFVTVLLSLQLQSPAWSGSVFPLPLPPVQTAGNLYLCRYPPVPQQHLCMTVAEK